MTNTLTIVTITMDSPDELKLTLESYPSSSLVTAVVVDASQAQNFDTNHKNITSASSALGIPIKHVRQSSKGQFNAHNQGLGLARTSHVIFLDGGDQLISNIDIDSILCSLEPAAPACFFQCILLDSLHTKIGINPPSYLYFYHSAIKFFPSIYWPCHQAIIFNRKSHVSIQYADQPIGSDQSVIKHFLSLDGNQFHDLPICYYDTRGISSVPPLSLSSLRKQILASLQLKQPRRVALLVTKYLLSKILFVHSLDFARHLRYNYFVPPLHRFLKTLYIIFK